MILDPRTPSGPLEQRWTKAKEEMRLVGPINRHKFKVIVVGTGLAGASVSATLGQQGYDVHTFTFHDSPRRAHSIAAQGGINAAKNYQNDGDSTWRLFYDTIKGGDYRARESNVYRLAQVSANIIDQCVAQGVPFAREYGGTLANRTFGGVLVSRTFYARGQTGQQLLLGAYSSLMREVHEKRVKLYTRYEMHDLIVKDGEAQGIVTRNLMTGELEAHTAHAVLLCTGGYTNVYYLSTTAMASNVSATWRAYKRGAFFGNPCYVQIHPTCIPVSGTYQSKLTLMSESLRNVGRVWVPRKAGDKRHPNEIPEDERIYFLEERYPTYSNMVPRDVASRNCQEWCNKGHGVGISGESVYLDFREAIAAEGEPTIRAKYGNLFHMYHKIMGEDPYKQPMKIYPGPHYVMGGLWVDYHLMSNVPGLFVLGEANFSDHGANRLGASALMQGLSDGYFVAPYTVANYLASKINTQPLSTDDEVCKEAIDNSRNTIDRLLKSKGNQSAESFHRRLGKILFDKVGITRTKEGLQEAIKEIQELRKDFWENVRVPGDANYVNQELEKAGRIIDFIEFGELMARDALHREESCGGHFRAEHETADGEAKRDDENYAYAAAWGFNGIDEEPTLNKDELKFEFAKLTQRSYK
ncbi:MAG: fumarate reductase/succinate dehydrogenase flavoprotein subunit [Myxococcales bacterium]|nr:fumarate reductase/succinate dehydrogenase flavoprotein subunit [Myxococcales bacterium]